MINAALFLCNKPFVSDCCNYNNLKRPKLIFIPFSSKPQSPILNDYQGAVAVELNERFAGWRMDIVESMVIKPEEVRELLGGVIVY